MLNQIGTRNTSTSSFIEITNDANKQTTDMYGFIKPPEGRVCHIVLLVYVTHATY